MGLMRLGSTVEGGPAAAPASRASGKGSCCEVEGEGRGGICAGVILELLPFLSSISKPLLESKISCVISLFLEQNSIVVKTAYS